MIIDFHTHTFPKKIAVPTLEKLQRMARSKPYTDATEDELRRSMDAAGIDVSILLPVMTNSRQVQKLNERAAQLNESWEQTGLLSFGGMHPECTEYREQLSHAAQMGLKGIKLHPAYQGMDFDDIRYLRIIDRACELGLIIMTHAGIDIGIPNHDYCSPKHVKHVMQEIAPDKLILAHMGGWQNWDEVEQELAGMPLYFDTAFSTGVIRPAAGTTRAPEESRQMDEQRFAKLVRAHGCDRVLFATDCPWSAQDEVLNFVKNCGFSEQEEKAILGENARRLLNI